jgi:hypothetical protein
MIVNFAERAHKHILAFDRSQVLRAVRSRVAGDEAALYNTLLLTLKDAAQYTGRKVVVVLSNGPDNSSVVPPEDVAEFAQSAGVSIYMISTQEAKLEPVSTAVFERMTAATGGKAYFAKSRRDEKEPLLPSWTTCAHLYSLSYYPKPNPNSSWRAITVKRVGEHRKRYKIRTRNGYRLQPSRFSSDGKLPGRSLVPSCRFPYQSLGTSPSRLLWMTMPLEESASMLCARVVRGISSSAPASDFSEACFLTRRSQIN